MQLLMLREYFSRFSMSASLAKLEELDVEGILAFAERVLRRASDPLGPSLARTTAGVQLLFFPDGISFDGNGFVRTGVTAPFSYLREIGTEKEGLVARIRQDTRPEVVHVARINSHRRNAIVPRHACGIKETSEG